MDLWNDKQQETDSRLHRTTSHTQCLYQNFVLGILTEQIPLISTINFKTVYGTASYRTILWLIGFTCPIIFPWISAPRPLT